MSQYQENCVDSTLEPIRYPWKLQYFAIRRRDRKSKKSIFPNIKRIFSEREKKDEKIDSQIETDT